MLEQKKDENGNPIFKYLVELEGIEGCSGEGFSKKESQQLASKLTLEQLKRQSKFIDEVFAAKTNRTKMEEEPVTIVPDVAPKDDFIITKTAKIEKHESPFQEEVFTDDDQLNEEKLNSSLEAEIDELHLDDINAAELSREEIVAKAEQQAFSQQK